MGISTLDINGSDQIGVHLARVGDVVFHSIELDATMIETIESAMQLETAAVSIGGSNLVGSLLAGTSKGLAVADIASENDIDSLTSYGDVIVMEGGVNTAGNLVMCNEKGAIVSPSVPEQGLELLAEVLRVDVAAVSVAGQDVVGSLGLCNDQGCLLHPDVTTLEVETISNVLGVPAMVGTVAFGSPYIGAGAIASNNGALVGAQTTGPEMNRLEDALGLI